MSVFDRLLDILRVMVAPANDDQVFDAADDQAFVVDETALIPGAQEGPILAALQMPMEGFGCFFGMVPISTGNAGPRDPQFSNLTWSSGDALFRIHNQQRLITKGLPAPGDRLGVRSALRKESGTVFAEGFLVQAEGARTRAAFPTGYHQRGFRQAITGEESRFLKAERRVCGAKSVHRFGAYGFCPVEGQIPTAQIQPAALIGRYAVNAKVVSEIWPAAHSGFKARNCLQPQQWLLQKNLRGH